MESSQVSLPMALLAALLLASFSASIAEARHLHRIKHHNFGASSFCERAEFPQLCYSFASKVPTATAESVIKATVQEAVSGAMNAKVLADKLMISPTTGNEVKGGIDICRQNFGMLVRDLQKGLDILNGAGSHHDLMNNLSTALTDIDSCDETFNEAPGLRSPVSDLTSSLRRLALNSIALADELN